MQKPTSLLRVPAATILIFIAACGKPSGNDQASAAYPVFQLSLQDTHFHIDYPAEIHAVQQVEIRARVNGYLKDILVDEGAAVSGGQMLFKLDPGEYREELNKARALFNIAQAELRSSELEYQNAVQLGEKKIISNTEVKLAANKVTLQKAKAEEARAQLAQAEIRYDNTIIRAPFPGIINRIPLRKGSLIDNGTLLTSLSDNREVFAYFDISEKEFLQFQKYAQGLGITSKGVALILSDDSVHAGSGKIETVEGAIDRNSGNIAIRARFSNEDGLLRHGASGKVRIRQNLNKVLLVPQKATFDIQDKSFVYVVDKDGRVQARNVVIARRLPHWYAISEGLKPGEIIVSEGTQSLKNNDKIRPVMKSAQSSASQQAAR
jgi:membrane fusion protein (multidrug efflux system)